MNIKKADGNLYHAIFFPKEYSVWQVGLFGRENKLKSIETLVNEGLFSFVASHSLPNSRVITVVVIRTIILKSRPVA